MATTTVTIEMPEELAALLGPAERLPDTVLETLVLDLLRDVRITQGEAAILLGVTRYDILDLMIQHRIPAGPATPDEVDQELEAVRKIMLSMTDDGGQRQ